MSLSRRIAEHMPIGALAKLAGVKVQTIRYYEEIGLMPVPDRTSSNRRTYGTESVQQLSFIRHARELGFAISAIRSLLELQSHPKRACTNADAIAREQLESVTAKIARLEALKRELSRMIASCAHGDIASCRVIEVLSDHSLCDSDHGQSASSRVVDKTQNSERAS